MPHEKAKIKMLTVNDANALLPRIRLILRSLREQRASILRTEAQVEIEEMTGINSEGVVSPGAQMAIAKLMEAFHYQTRQFEEKLEELSQMGAHLKDLNQGIVDFYSQRGNEIVFLCWREDENKIHYWHKLQGSYKNRQPL